MGQAQAKQWARTAQKRSSHLRSRRSTTLLVAAVLAVALYFALRRSGAPCRTSHWCCSNTRGPFVRLMGCNEHDE